MRKYEDKIKDKLWTGMVSKDKRESNLQNMYLTVGENRSIEKRVYKKMQMKQMRET